VAEQFVLDAYAVLALLADEPGADEVAALLADESIRFHVSAVNVGEIVYVLLRRAGEQAAAAAESAVYDHPRITVAGATRDRIRAAAAIKARGGLSLADAFAAALAEEVASPLITGDPEFKRMESGTILIRWLPRR